MHKDKSNFNGLIKDYYSNWNDYDNSLIVEPGYLSYFSAKAKKLISPTTYYLGNYKIGIDNTINSYISERDSSNIHEGNQATWNGLIGLLYPSDYGYTFNTTYWKEILNVRLTDFYNKSWLPNVGWLISPSMTSKEHIAYNNIFVEEIAIEEILSDPVDPSDFPILPTLYLVSNAKIYPDGTGTYENPYVVIEE